MDEPDPHAAAPAAIGPSAEILVRLRRIEGQVRGPQRMLERGDTCREMLAQVGAARAALAAVGLRLVECEVRRATMAAADGGPGATDDAAAPVVAAVELLLAR